MRNLPLLIPFLLLVACGGKEDLKYSTNCGDPACSGNSGAMAGVAACSSEVAGATCSEEGSECDLENTCNQRLICASEDPSTMCPASEAKHKRNIVYVDAQRATQIQEKLQKMKIAEWKYNWDSAQRDPHLGFIIDDNPNIPAVLADGRRVDLYGYTSMAVVAIQNQARQIQTLETRIKELEQRLVEISSKKNSK